MFGTLPNYDFFMNYLKLDMPQEEYIVGGGNVIGEIGLVTGRRYDMTVTCETSVQLYYTPWKVMRALLYESSNCTFIRAKIWKAIAIKVGVNLLPHTTRFQGWSREKLLLYLQRGFVPILTGITVLNINPEFVEDVFVIEGVTMDMATRSTFVAPIMVPHTVQKILLPESSLWDFDTVHETQLLIILSVHAHFEDIMGTEGIFKGNFKDRDVSEKSVEGEFEDEASTGEGDKTGTEKCHTDRKKMLPSKLLLELRKKEHKKISFMEYAPTLTGALEESSDKIVFSLKTNIGKMIRPSQHSRNMFRFNLNYTQDVLGTNEIESLVEGDLKESAGPQKRGGSRHKARTVSPDVQTDTQPRMSMVSQKVDDSKITELMEIKSDTDEEDNLESKSVQTYIEMDKRYYKRPSTRKFPDLRMKELKKMKSPISRVKD